MQVYNKTILYNKFKNLKTQNKYKNSDGSANKMPIKSSIENEKKKNYIFGNH